MGYDGAGGYDRSKNFSADASAGIKILASGVDTEFDDFASAMTLARLRDGQNAPTANLPMGGFRHVNAGAAASASDYIRAKEIIENVPLYVIDSESGDATKASASALYYTSVSANQAPADGSRALVRFASNKSASCAFFFQGGGGTAHSANIYGADGKALWDRALLNNAILEVVYNSALGGWQALNPHIIESSSFSCTVTGVSGSADIAFQAVAAGDIVILRTGGRSQNSNASTMTVTSIPAAFRPAVSAESLCLVKNNNVDVLGRVIAGTDGTLVFEKASTNLTFDAGGFSADGNKGIPGNWQMSYRRT